MAIIPVLVLFEVFILILGAGAMRELSASLRQQVESAQAAGESENALRLAKQMSRTMRGTALSMGGLSLVPMGLIIGLLIATELTMKLMAVVLIALFILVIFLALALAVPAFIINPLRASVRDVRFARQVQHQAKAK